MSTLLHKLDSINISYSRLPSIGDIIQLHAAHHVVQVILWHDEVSVKRPCMREALHFPYLDKRLEQPLQLTVTRSSVSTESRFVRILFSYGLLHILGTLRSPAEGIPSGGLNLVHMNSGNQLLACSGWTAVRCIQAVVQCGVADQVLTDLK